ncbi:hypothetical protein CYMTET_31516 [Cymbomonas tetramitiformis]|uniref:Carboxylic ester hydrolase n=1 Tax=Cymbomonas tetramitiformis TaxID=36881 RepID=A0AAE0KSU1_9CHLO|nr:hypothetical protein CYMTET_31516 [Cymbomonas tetramitiformis]
MRPRKAGAGAYLGNGKFELALDSLFVNNQTSPRREYSGSRFVRFYQLSRRRPCVKCAGYVMVLLMISVAVVQRAFISIIEIECGTAIGFRWPHQALTTYMSVPYAAPPTGAHRWQPTIPLRDEGDCTPKLLNGVLPGGVCLQDVAEPSYLRAWWTRYVLQEATEDCLTLSIWRPTAPSAPPKLPTMVYFHEGGLLSGHGLTDFSKFVMTNRVLVVDVNYRLNVFGFLATVELSATNRGAHTSGNYGLLDAQEALRWVQRNIHHFGGDPDKVTVFGLSSGGTMVFMLLASPQSKGLFHRAMSNSGSPNISVDLAAASKRNQVIVERVGCTSNTSTPPQNHCPDVIVLDAEGPGQHVLFGVATARPMSDAHLGAAMMAPGAAAKKVEESKVAMDRRYMEENAEGGEQVDGNGDADEDEEAAHGGAVGWKEKWVRLLSFALARGAARLIIRRAVGRCPAGSGWRWAGGGRVRGGMGPDLDLGEADRREGAERLALMDRAWEDACEETDYATQDGLGGGTQESEGTQREQTGQALAVGGSGVMWNVGLVVEGWLDWRREQRGGPARELGGGDMARAARGTGMTRLEAQASNARMASMADADGLGWLSEA